ncbi:MAG TPA: roadblock/LC7 domain-containing protein [Rugosimonospora sp.]|nr:roadblock/LC7 domain-containing protein [Rugosimonospora sp.]
MTINPTSRNNLAWMLDGLVEIPHVVYAIVLSTDGLIIQKSTRLPMDTAEVIAAGACSLYSLVRGVGQHFESGPVQQAIIEYGDRTLLVAEAGKNARLAVVCEQSVDMGTVGYEMSRLVTRIGEFLGTEARSAALAMNQTGKTHDG